MVNADAATQADLKAEYEAARATYVAAPKSAYGKYQALVTEASASARIDLARAVLYAKAINATFAPDAPPGWGNEDPGLTAMGTASTHPRHPPRRACAHYRRCLVDRHCPSTGE